MSANSNKASLSPSCSARYKWTLSNPNRWLHFDAYFVNAQWTEWKKWEKDCATFKNLSILHTILIPFLILGLAFLKDPKVLRNKDLPPSLIILFTISRWRFREGLKVWEKKILKWVPKKTSNPEKYWLKIPEILGLEIYEGKNLKKMVKNRGKTFAKFWCWASLENTVRIDAKCCKAASFNDH